VGVFSEHNVHKICTILTANLPYLICNLLQQPAFFDVVYVLQTQKTMQCCCHCTLQSTVHSNWGTDFWMEGPYSIHGTTTMSDACGSANLKNYHYNQCYVYAMFMTRSISRPWINPAGIDDTITINMTPILFTITTLHCYGTAST